VWYNVGKTVIIWHIFKMVKIVHVYVILIPQCMYCSCIRHIDTTIYVLYNICMFSVTYFIVVWFKEMLVSAP
jgi:hypothetical protein